MARFQDKVCVVTGSSSGLGYEVALELAKQGAQVIAVGQKINELEKLDDAAKEAGASGKIVITALDLKCFNQIDELGLNIYRRYGRLDILVSCAAIFDELCPLVHIKPEAWQKILDVNLTANWRLLRSFDALLRVALAARVAFVGCMEMLENPAYYGAYAVSKAALQSVVEIYSKETAQTKIKANLFMPGAMATKLWKSQFPGREVDTIAHPRIFVEDILKLVDETCDFSGRLVRVEKELERV